MYDKIGIEPRIIPIEQFSPALAEMAVPSAFRSGGYSLEVRKFKDLGKKELTPFKVDGKPFTSIIEKISREAIQAVVSYYVYGEFLKFLRCLNEHGDVREHLTDKPLTRGIMRFYIGTYADSIKNELNSIRKKLMRGESVTNIPLLSGGVAHYNLMNLPPEWRPLVSALSGIFSTSDPGEVTFIESARSYIFLTARHGIDIMAYHGDSGWVVEVNGFFETSTDIPVSTFLHERYGPSLKFSYVLYFNFEVIDGKVILKPVTGKIGGLVIKNVYYVQGDKGKAQSVVVTTEKYKGRSIPVSISGDGKVSVEIPLNFDIKKAVEIYAFKEGEGEEESTMEDKEESTKLPAPMSALFGYMSALIRLTDAASMYLIQRTKDKVSEKRGVRKFLYDIGKQYYGVICEGFESKKKKKTK